MFYALNMELDIVRTVIKNEVNEIYVCTDTANSTGVFYTMISISSAKHRKILANKMNNEGLFFGNKDFVGSFVFSNKLNLVFRYYHENLLSLMGGVYLYNFVECKSAALSFIANIAETNTSGAIGLLLLEDRNINITKEGEVILNYFLDFEQLDETVNDTVFLNRLGKKVFSILEQNYKEKYMSPELYPDDLQVFYLRMKNLGFTSFGQMISIIRDMSDKPIEMRGIIWWITNKFTNTKGFLFRNGMTTFLTILVIVTMIYAGTQIKSRWLANKAYDNSVSYYGIEQIGDVYLGDEE